MAGTDDLEQGDHLMELDLLDWFFFAVAVLTLLICARFLWTSKLNARQTLDDNREVLRLAKETVRLQLETNEVLNRIAVLLEEGNRQSPPDTNPTNSNNTNTP